jgi:hypothetical protein
MIMRPANIFQPMPRGSLSGNWLPAVMDCFLPVVQLISTRSVP